MNTGKPAPALPSATIVLLRDGQTDPQVLMVKRRAGDAFGENYTFPGGVVDADEGQAHPFCDGRTAAEAGAELQLSDGALDYYSAAVRELFEETGILLAKDRSGHWPFAQHNDSAHRLRTLRAELNSGNISWSGLLELHELRVACDALHYFSFWETPLRLPKRWATRFFMAVVPPQQNAEHDGLELTDSRWMTVIDVLGEGRQGAMLLPFPTVATLNDLVGFDSVGGLIDWAASRAAAGVDKILPAVPRNASEIRYVIPGDPDYPPDSFVANSSLENDL